MSHFQFSRFVHFSSYLSLGLFLETQGIANEVEPKHSKPAPTSSSSVQSPAVPVNQKRTQTGCIVDEAALEDFKKTKMDNEAREKDLTGREADLKAREKAFAEELKKLEQTRDSIKKISDEKKKEREEKVAKLVETFLTMSPKAAAKILATLDDDLAVSVLSQMEIVRLAKVMNVMEPSRSAQLSEMLVGISKLSRIITQTQVSGPKFIKSEPNRESEKGTHLSRKGGQKSDGLVEDHASVEQQLAGKKGNFSEKAEK